MSVDERIEWRVNFHKALSNAERMKIVDLLADGEQCQCDIFPQIGLSQSTSSAYLTQLVRAGILKVKRDGVRKIYSISDSKLSKVIRDIRSIAEIKTD